MPRRLNALLDKLAARGHSGAMVDRGNPSSRMALLGVAAACIALASCATATAPPPVPTRVVSISIWEGGCFSRSRCTTYTMTLSDTDHYQLSAENHVRQPGERRGRLQGGFVKALAALNRADFDALPDRLDSATLTDLPPPGCFRHLPGLRVAIIRADGTDKSLFWDQGCPSPAARQLRDELRAAISFDALIAPPP